MEIVVFSNPGKLEKEADWINRLFNAGLARFHLRKPGWSEKQHRQLLDLIEPAFHSKIIIHRCFELCRAYGLEGIHLGTSYKREGFLGAFARKMISIRYGNYLICTTCNYLSDLDEVPEWVDMVFLSPVFGAISEKTCSSGFDHRRMKAALNQQRNHKIFALGGVDSQTISQAEALNFDGAAMIGAIWSRKDQQSPLDAYQSVVTSSGQRLATA